MPPRSALPPDPRPLPLPMLQKTAALTLFLLAVSACSSPEGGKAEVLPPGAYTDAWGERGGLDALAGPLPAILAVQEASAVEEALRLRGAQAAAELPLVTILDASALGELQQEELLQALLEAALEDGGPILVDRDGGSARELRAGLQPPVFLRVEAGLEVRGRASGVDALPGLQGATR